jgi:hypothetical protein
VASLCLGRHGNSGLSVNFCCLQSVFLTPFYSVVGISSIPLTLLAGALTPQKLIPASAAPGLKFASTQVLRAGVVCVGECFFGFVLCLFVYVVFRRF